MSDSLKATSGSAAAILPVPSEDKSHHAEQPRKPGSRALLGPVLAALVLTLVLVTLPRLPLGTDDDSSWSAVMGYAHQNGLQFGTDIAFSYGPLGFLITPYYSPSNPWLRVATDFLLTFLVASGLSLLAWRMPVRWRTVALCSFALLASNADPRSELLINIGLLCWSLLCLVEVGTQPVDNQTRAKLPAAASLALFGALAVFCALAKMTLLSVAVLGVVIVSVCMILHRQARRGLGLLLGSVAGLLVAWLCLGQNLLHLGPYFLNGLRLTAAYDQTMWADPYPGLKWAGLLMLALAAGALFLSFERAQNQKRSKWYRTLMRVWLCAFLFVIWKHGFVRAGRDHVEVFFGFVPTLALALDAWPFERRSRRLWARGLTLACCLVAVLALRWLFAGNLTSVLTRPFRLAAQHAASVWAPAKYQAKLKDLQQVERTANQLPHLSEKIGRGSVDVFGCSQAYAIFNDLNYRPRPVFQSYAAYSAPLMNLNEQFYFSPRAPEFVLFSLNPIDERFPPLEDARLFRDLFINYQPIGVEGPFLLLKTKPPVAPTLTLLREGTIGPGDVVGLKEYGNANLWLQMDLKPNPLGWVSRLLYRPSEVTLAAWCDKPTIRVARFRAPAPMLSAGFLASPLPLDNADIVDLYTGKPITRPSAYSIELSAGAQHLWNDAIHFRLYKIENQLGKSASKDVLRLTEFPGFESAPEEINAARHATLTIEGKPALFVSPGGYMTFAIPPKSKVIEGSFGFAPAAYALGGATEGAEFRIEQELADGKFRLLESRVLKPRTNPDDRGMKRFAVNLVSTGPRKLVLRARSLGKTINMWDLTCWADVRFR